jgi:Flp pilus assembly protein CpaB
MRSRWVIYSVALGLAVAVGAGVYFYVGTVPSSPRQTRSGAGQAGQAIQAGVSQTATGSSTVFKLPAGMQAISFAFDDAARVGGAVIAGARVGVYWTPANASLTRLVVEDCEVLAVGSAGTVASTFSPSSGSLVTLAVLPQDAARLTLASKTGSLQLALLASDASAQKAQRITQRQLREGK